MIPITERKRRRRKIDTVHFYTPKQKLIDAGNEGYLIYIPAEHITKALESEFDSPVVAVVRQYIGNLIIAAMPKPGKEMFLSLLIKENFLGKPLTYVKKDGEPILDFEIVGSVIALAPFDGKVLKFKPI